jgi:DNA-directed RNA polymerase specialized sigma subunit
MEDVMRSNSVDLIDDYFMAKTSARNDKDLELWHSWKQDPTPEKLEPLLQQFKPTIAASARKFRAPNVNPAAFNAVLQSHAIKAFEGYDPQHGASLNTYVTQRLQGAQRFNEQGQNMAYIPHDKVRHIGAIDKVYDELYQESGREPTHAEIGSQLGLSPKLVKTVQESRRADIRSGSFESDPIGHASSRDVEVMNMLRPELSPDAQRLYDLIYPPPGQKPVTSTGQLAKRLGVSDSRVSRLKNEIIATHKKFR